MDIIYLAFANDRKDPLPSLQREDDTLYSLLAPGQARQHYLIHRDSFADLGKITEYLTLYKNNIVLFHYSGHAGMEGIHLAGEQAFATGIAELLGQCPRLKLVLLNGCSTIGQVRQLLEKGGAVVIATDAPVNDNKAAEFSIHFYRAMANQEELNDAFEAAKGKILAMDKRVAFHRGPGFEASEGEGAWGIFYKEHQQPALAWRLPTVPFSTLGNEFKPNELLLTSLVDSLSAYNEDVRKIQSEEQFGVAVNILDKREAILKCLPHPISEQVRKLLVPEGGDREAGFYDKLGPRRLQQMVRVFTTSIEILGFIMLAQLWDALSDNPDLAVPEELRQLIQQFFTLSPGERQSYDFLPLIRKARKTLEDNKIPYFVKEIPDIRDRFESGTPFYEAFQFMESMKRKFRPVPPGKAEADTFCILAEEKLAVILSELGFIAHYTFASVKSIDVLKYRHLKKARFRHTVVRLVQRFVGLAEEPQVMEKFMDNASVVLLREEKGQLDFLNLTPFVIDENAFNEKASIAKLHFFDRYVPEQDAYAYRHIYKPNDLPLVVIGKAPFAILKAQFEDFARLVFKKPMNQLV